MTQQARISKREIEVLELIGEEMTIKEIASTLYISHHTVVSHRKNLMEKMDARNQVGLYKKALQYGLLSLSRINKEPGLRWAV